MRHRHRSGQGADPHRRRRAASVTRDSGVPAQGEIRIQRTRAAMPHHHRGSREQLHSRLRHASPPTAVRPASASAWMRARPMPAPSSRRCYDSLLVKVTTWAPTPEETIARMHRALWEFRIRGVVTNLRFLDQIITHPRFARGDYTTRFIDETPGAVQLAAQARPRHAHPELPRRHHRQRQSARSAAARAAGCAMRAAHACRPRAAAASRRRARKQLLR